MLSGEKLPDYRFPLTIISYAVWLYHRFTLSFRDIEALLLERGSTVSRESIRARWHLDEMHVDIGGITYWLWRAVDETGAVLDVYLQRHRDTEAGRTSC